MKLAAPSFNPGGGTYATTQNVTISACSPAPCTTLYSTDGSDPSVPYTAPVAITTTSTLKAKAVKTNWTTSNTTSATYTLSLGTLAAPTLTPGAGTFLGSQAVSMSSIAGATIHYTLDGATDPTVNSPTYTSPITLTVTTTVKAKAFHPDWATSPTATATYTIKVAAAPDISLPSGEYPLGQAVTVTSSDPGAVILYTLDGNDPTTAASSVSSGTTLYLMQALTLKAVASRTGCLLSDVASAAYTVTGTLPTVAVKGGDYHSLLATADGALWAWGDNSNGQVGDGTVTQRTTPVSLASPTGVVSVSGGSVHSVAATSGGRVWAWGGNTSGQLGDGTTTKRTAPVLLTNPTGVVSASTGVGAIHTLAAKSDGTAWAWGYNSNGQLGDGTTTRRTSPVQVSGLTSAALVAGGTSHSLAVKSDGTAWAWGLNSNGQLGDGTTTRRLAPVQTSGLTGVVGAAGGYAHSLAVKSDGTAWAWGLNNYGQVGDGTTTTQRNAPVQVTSLTGVVGVASGMYHSLAIRSDGTAWAWGYNTEGELGDGTTTARRSPVQVPIPGPVIAVGAGRYHSLAVTLDGTFWAWGYNVNGQLGLGTTATPVLVPTPVSDSGYNWRVGMPVFSVGSGTYHQVTSATLTSVTPGSVTICYTTDGSDPGGCQQSVASGGSVQVTSTLTLKAQAFKSGMSPSAVAQASYTLALNAPTLSQGPGTRYADLSLTMTPPASPPSGVEIRYTTDGSDPTPTTGTVYTSPVPVTQTQTLLARAFKTGWTQSSQAGGLYTMKVATPALAPPGGSYTAAQSVSLSTTTSGAQIRYTTDGVEPTLANPSGTSVTVDHSLTLKAKGFRDGWTASDTAVGAYFLTVGSAAAPTMDPPGGTYDTPQLVALRTVTAGARIRYTLDGSDPTLASASYVAPVAVEASGTLKAKAFAADLSPSTTATAAYTITAAPDVATPQFVPASAQFTTGQLVTVTCSTPGAAIHYTTDGSDPDQADPSISSGQTVSVDHSMTLKAKAWLSGAESGIRLGNYAITGAIAGGLQHNLALESDGHVRSWGLNNWGQLGDGTTTSQNAPVEVLASAGVPLADVVAIGSGQTHSLAVKSNGHVWAWGENRHGELGNGTSTSVPVVHPVEVQLPSPQGPLTGVVAVAGGEYHSLALKSDGTVWSWGYNGHGRLGDGTTTNRTSAVQVRTSPSATLTGVVAIAASHTHSLALRSDGTAWGWGYGLGVDGSTNSLLYAVQVPGLSGIVGVGTGVTFSVATRLDGSVWGWGDGRYGQLGDHTATTTPVVRATRAASLTSAVRADVGPGSTHVLGLVRGSAGEQWTWTWGAGTSGQLGGGPESLANRAVPGPVNLRDVIAVSGGQLHSIALLEDGSVWTWGSNSQGQLGRGQTGQTINPAPESIPNLTLADNTWLLGDPDGDGLTTGEEWRLGTDCLDADTNGDGVPDGAAPGNGVSPTDPDSDLDGVPNALEVEQGTDPLRWDTDGDGVGDGQDCFPLDPERWQCPTPVPGDVTPPVIQLTEPTNAVLISSLP